MKISNLKDMEVFVDSCPVLKWDGWNVLFLEEDPMAYMNIDAVFYKNKWHKKTLISFENGHWNIPKKIRNICA